MTKQTNKSIFIALIVLGVIAIIVSVVNFKAVMGPQGVPVIPSYVTWGLNIIQVILLVYVIFSCRMKKTNLFWILVLSLGCIVIGIRQLLKVNK